MIKTILGLAVILLGSMVVTPAALAQAPALFYTDLTVAPNSGGESVSGFAGAYVTLYGNNFGTTQGASTVTWNGQSCLRVVNWAQTWLWYQKMVVQLGSGCASGTGNFLVTTSSGTSIGLTFTVNANSSNHIYFAASGGSDSAAGTISAPFATMVKCKNALVPGDICYVKAGVNQPGVDNYGSLDLCTTGTAAAPLAIIAYPGTALSDTIGSDSRDKGLYFNGGLSACKDGQYWTASGFKLRSNSMAAMIYSANNRLVANYVSCPAANGVSEGCIEPASTTNIKVIGNEVTALGNGGKLFHAIYFGADGHDYEAAWNYIHDLNQPAGSTGGCRGIQFNNATTDTYNVSVHDNLIGPNIPCDGINLYTVDPSKGFVLAYNNVVFGAGSGPDLGGQNATCINIATNNSTSGSVQVYNITFYNCGALHNSDSAMLSPYIATHFYNNIVQASGSESYFTSGSGSSHLTGSNNIWFGAGNGPATTTGNVNVNPLLVNLGIDFHLQSSSPAIDAGIVSSGLTMDFVGVPRPQGAGYDIGAFEFFQGGSTVQKPNPPTNLTVAVQ
jgi:hypothetical protein